MSSLKKHFSSFGSHHDAPPLSPACQSGGKIDAQVSFKADVLNCLDQCAAYIQALNNLCSVGSIFAASLTQFSRDFAATGLLPPEPPTTKSESRRRLLRLKSGLVPNSRVAPDPDPDSDCLYYDMTEQFLRVWETMSVSTAGASATIKTETLMTLQEVVNQLESADDSDCSADQSLGKSIQSAKSCLLAYIELQAQFSFNSWKSLNHLSKALKSDANMTDVVKNIRQHFDSKSSSSQSPASSRPEEKSQESSSAELKKQNCCTVRSVSGLKEAMDLLSLDDDSRSGKKRRRIKCRKKEPKDQKSRNPVTIKSGEGQNRADSQTMPSSTRFSHLGDKCFSSSQMESATVSQEPDLRSQSTSTWPGKGVLSHTVTSAQAPEVLDSWSLWSSASPSFGQTSAWRDTTEQMSWNVFPPQSSQSLSRLRTTATAAALSASTLSGSGASSNASIGVPSSTSSSVATNRNYDLFSPTQKNPVTYFDGTNSVLASISNNNNNDLNFHGFASLNDVLRSNDTTSPTAASAKSSLTFDPQTLSSFGSGVRSPLISADYEPLLIAPGNGSESTRFKTCTWPLKQESMSATCAPVFNNSPSLTNSNWIGVSSVVPHNNFPSDNNQRPFDNELLDQRQVTTQSLWSFDVPDKGNPMHRQMHHRQLNNLSLQSSLPVHKSDVTGFTLFEANNNCGVVPDKNF